jgi:hypothetical protein
MCAKHKVEFDDFPESTNFRLKSISYEYFTSLFVDFEKCRLFQAELERILRENHPHMCEQTLDEIIQECVFTRFWKTIRGEEIKELSKQLLDCLFSPNPQMDEFWKIHLKKFFCHTRKNHLKSPGFFLWRMEVWERYSLQEITDSFKNMKESAILKSKEKKERLLIQGCFNNKKAADDVLDNKHMNSEFIQLLADRASHHGVSVTKYVTGGNFPLDFGENIFKFKRSNRTTARKFLMHVSADCRPDASKDACKRCRLGILHTEECECNCDCNEYEGDSEACKHHGHPPNDYTHHKCSLCKFVQCEN